MIGRLIGLISPLTGIADRLARAYEAKQNANTEAERIRADVEIEQLQARQKVLINGGKVTAVIQAAWALPFILFTWKVIVWDKILGLGVTDGLGDNERILGQTIAGFYFLTAGAMQITKAIRR